MQSLTMWFISGLGSHKCLFMTYMQTYMKKINKYRKQVQEKLFSRLKSAQKTWCEKYKWVRIISSVTLWLKVGEGQQVPKEPKWEIFSVSKNTGENILEYTAVSNKHLRTSSLCPVTGTV